MDAIAVGTGEATTCAVHADGSVACWGNNMLGMLGNGTTGTGFQSMPVDALGLSNAVSVGVGHAHTCAVTRGGQIYCWGANDHGQDGAGVSDPMVTTPTRVQGF